MRLFVDYPVGADLGSPFVGPLRLRPGRGYDEIEWRTGRRLPALVVYQIPMTSSISSVAACCGNAFDAALVALDGGPDSLHEEVAEYWYNFGVLLVKGQEGDLSDRGLVRIVDPDDGVKKSFVATTLPARPSAEDTKRAVVRAIEGAASTIGQAVEAAEVRPIIRRLLKPPNDYYRLDELLQYLSNWFPLSHLSEALEIG